MWILKHFNENKWQEFALTLVSVWSSTEARYLTTPLRADLRDSAYY